MLLNFPKDISFSLFGNWLLFSTLRSLDSAVCNHEWRPNYLENLSGVFISSSLDITSDMALKKCSDWLNSRLVVVGSMSCSNISKDVTLMPINLSKLKKISFDEKSYVDGKLLENLFSKTDQSTLEVVNIHCRIYNDIYSLLGNHTHIKHLTTPLKVPSIEDTSAFITIFKSNALLESISLQIDECLSEPFNAISKAICDFCPNLTSFAVYNCHPIVAEGYNMIIDHFPKLTSLSIVFTAQNIASKIATLKKISKLSQLTTLNLSGLKMSVYNFIYNSHTTVLIDVGLVDIFKGCKLLRHLNLSKSEIQCSIFRELAIHCIDLETLEISGLNNGPLDDLMHVFRDCKKLTKLDISNCAELDNHVVFAISCYCSNLIDLNVSGRSRVLNALYTDLLQGCDKLQKLKVSIPEFQNNSEVTKLQKSLKSECDVIFVEF